MRSEYCRAALAFLIWAVPCAAAPTANTVPLHVFRSGHISVQARLNGQGPFRLVLDTGSPVTFISTKVAKKLGLSAGMAGSATSATGAPGGMFGMGLSMNPFARLKSVAIGSTVAKDLEIMVLDHPVIDMLSVVEGPVEGIIGFSFFSRFRTTLDYAGKQVTFSPVAFEPPDLMKNVFKLLMNRGGDKRIIAPAALWGMSLDKTAGRAGVVVTQVYAGGPAEAAGLLAGDIITSVDSRWTESVLDFFDLAATIKPGRDVMIQAARGGVAMDLRVRPRTGL